MATSHKRKADTYDKSDYFVNDDDDDDDSNNNDTSSARVAPPTAKRSKGITSASSSSNGPPSSVVKRDADDNEYWEISKARRVQLSEFKGKKMISIREYYEKDGKWLPGKKGISMTVEQYSEFLKVVPQIERSLDRDGIRVPRPEYGAGSVRVPSSNRRGGGISGGGGGGSADDSDDDVRGRAPKANHEATSDEEEEEEVHNDDGDDA